MGWSPTVGDILQTVNLNCERLFSSIISLNSTHYFKQGLKSRQIINYI